MFGRPIQLFRIAGFGVRLDPSWFLLAILVTWSLARGFPQEVPDLAREVYWAMGVAGALGLFASVILHELSHAVVARRFDLPIKGITLFIFGGVAEMESEPASARAEFWVAVAGPIASFLIAGGSFAVAIWGAGAGWPQPVVVVWRYLAGINLLLALFNLVPAFPLDGGRVLRSLLWYWKGSLRWATQVSAAVGSAFGVALIVLGVVRVVSGDFVGGMWLFLIGLFLRGAARSSYQHLLLRGVLQGEPVHRFMKRDPVTVQRAMSVRELVEEVVYRHHHKLYPVLDGERLVGCVTTRGIRELPREEWERQSVGAVAEPCDATNSVAPDDDALAALAKMRRSGTSRLLVVSEGRLLGLLTLKDLLEFFSLKVELDPAAADR